MCEELHAVPPDIANIVGEYMMSHGWEEVGKMLTL
jgi:hypothetical protein